jgi:hypothetical protein
MTPPRPRICAFPPLADEVIEVQLFPIWVVRLGDLGHLRLSPIRPWEWTSFALTLTAMGRVPKVLLPIK